MRKMSRKLIVELLIYSLVSLSFSSAAQPVKQETRRPSLYGYTINFNTLRSIADVKKSVAIALSAGAGVVNIVPPAHIWSNPTCVQMLETLFAETKAKNITVILSRVDANYPNGTNYLYSQILSQPGRLPE